PGAEDRQDLVGYLEVAPVLEPKRVQTAHAGVKCSDDGLVILFLQRTKKHCGNVKGARAARVPAGMAVVQRDPSSGPRRATLGAIGNAVQQTGIYEAHPSLAAATRRREAISRSRWRWERMSGCGP